MAGFGTFLEQPRGLYRFAVCDFFNVFFSRLVFEAGCGVVSDCVCSRSWPSHQAPRLYKTIFITQLSMKFFLLINVKMPTIVGILTFMSRKKIAFYAYTILKNAGFFESFITSGPDLTVCTYGFTTCTLPLK